MTETVNAKATYTDRLFALGCIFLCGVALYFGLYKLNIRSPQLLAENGNINCSGIDVSEGVYMLAGDWIVAPGAKLPDEMAAHTNTINVLTGGSMEGNTYRLALINCPLDAEFCLMLPRPRGSRLFINNEEVLSPSGEPIEADEVLALSPYLADGDALSITLQVPVSGYFYSGYQGILVGTGKLLLSIDSTRYFIEVLCLGMYTAMILLSLALFIQKTSEHYILLLVMLSFMTALRFADYSAYFRNYVFPNGSMDIYRLFICFRYILCRQIMGERPPKWMDRIVIVIIGLQVCVLLLLHTYFVQISDYCNVTLLILEWLLLLRGARAGSTGALVIAGGWTIYVGMELFYRLLDYGIIPQGMVDVQIKPTQYAHALYLIAFAIAVLGKFAQKFQQADILTASLEQKVQEQTKEIYAYSQQVIAVQEQRQQFMVDVVHNLRNPLFTLGGFMDMLEEELPKPTQSQQSYIDRINGKLEYVNQMVDDMLLISRLENGQITFSKTTFNAKAFLYSIAEDHKKKLGEKGIDISIICDAAIICIADRFRLRQALDNIIDNAYRHSCCKNIYLRAFPLHDATQIQVEDDGCGIPREKLETVFNRYSQSRAAHSAGLGLPIARGIVQGHGGSLILNAEGSEGVQVMISLPLG